MIGVGAFVSVVVGVCLGSFINLVSLRLARGVDWVMRPSHCFYCTRRLFWFENVPLIGWLRKMGRCGCKERSLPARYILVEVWTGCLFGASFVVLGWEAALAFSPFIVLLCIIFLTDMDSFRIPDWASVGGLCIGLLWSFLGLSNLPFALSLWGGVFGFGLIYAINALYKLLRGRDGFGFGDVKLMAMIGAWLGVASLLPILFAASLAGAIFGIFSLLVYRRRKTRLQRTLKKTGKAAVSHTQLAPPPERVPFGCFLVPMAFIWLFISPILSHP